MKINKKKYPPYLKLKDVVKNPNNYKLLLDHFSNIELDDVLEVLSNQFDLIKYEIFDYYHQDSGKVEVNIGYKFEEYNEWEILGKLPDMNYLSNDKEYYVYCRFYLDIKLNIRNRGRIIGFKDFGEFLDISKNSYLSVVNFQKSIKKMYNLDVMVNSYGIENDQDGQKNRILYGISIVGKKITISEIVEFFRSTGLKVEDVPNHKVKTKMRLNGNVFNNAIDEEEEEEEDYDEDEAGYHEEEEDEN